MVAHRSELRHRRRVALGLLVGVVAGANLLAASGLVVAAHRRAAQPGAAAAADQQATVLLATTSGSGRVGTLLLAGVDADRSAGTVLLVPPQTLTLLPGVGTGAVGDAPRYGGLALLTTATENLLRVRVDHTAALDQAAFGAVVDRLGGVDVTIPAPVVRRDRDGRRTLAFDAGPVHLDGAQAASLLDLVGEGEGPLDRYPRVQALWSAVLRRGHADPGGFVAALLGAGAAGDAAGLAATGQALAEAPQDAVAFQVLPVETGVAAFVTVDDQARPLLADGFGPSLLPDVDAGLRVQVLNGVGRPGATAGAAARLVEAGFSLPVGGNADHFGYHQTRVVVYGDSAAALALGERVRAALGVGTVEVSESPQSVVDVTVVVGDDALAPPAR
jgi:polyisoprenyl-teichoic acid--peptidoglycan teichoic acid transferase